MIESDQQHILGARTQQYLVFESHSHQVIELNKIHRNRHQHRHTRVQAAFTENPFWASPGAQATTSVIIQTESGKGMVNYEARTTGINQGTLGKTRISGQLMRATDGTR